MSAAVKHESGPQYDISRTGTGTLYDNPLIERLSRCHPTAPLWLFLPLVAVVGWQAFAATELGAGTIVGVFLVGIATWTLTEYWLHRVLFHITGESEALQTFHRRMHGIHHEYPNDMTRVVMPPAAAIWFAVVFGLLTWAALGYAYGLPFFGGLVVGYLWYDMTHWWTHTTRPRGAWGKLVRRHHMMHHFQRTDRRFGVSTPLWDWVFRTL